MAYRRKEVYIPNRDMYIISKGFSARIGKKASRAANTSETCEQQKKINEKNAADLRIWKILNNFREKHYEGNKVVHGDRWVTFTYKQDARTVSIEAAHKIFTGMLRRIKRKYKDCKYIGKTEMTYTGNVHHHLIISRDIPHDFMSELWSESEYANYIDDKEIYSLEDLRLANYFIKGEGTHKIVDCKYTASRNLDKPIIKTKIIKATKWRREPIPKRGYDIHDKQDYTDVFGFEAQRYILMRSRR